MLERDQASQMLAALPREISSLLKEAADLAEIACTFGEKGQAARAIDVLADIEPLMLEARSLLEAAFIAQRHLKRRQDGM